MCCKCAIAVLLQAERSRGPNLRQKNEKMRSLRNSVVICLLILQYAVLQEMRMCSICERAEYAIYAVSAHLQYAVLQQMRT